MRRRRRRRRRRAQKRANDDDVNDDVNDDDNRENTPEEETTMKKSARRAHARSASAYGQNGTCFYDTWQTLYARYSILSRIGNARWQKSRRLDVSLSLSVSLLLFLPRRRCVRRGIVASGVHALAVGVRDGIASRFRRRRRRLFFLGLSELSPKGFAARVQQRPLSG